MEKKVEEFSGVECEACSCSDAVEGGEGEGEVEAVGASVEVEGVTVEKFSCDVVELVVED